jgi:opacity protein-like surface antigen
VRRHLPIACLLALLGAVPVSASSFEFGVHGGRVAPFYQQTFHYGPGALPPLIPGADIRQEGTFTLDARGSTALGGSASLYLLPLLGLEARLDTLDVQVNVTGARFDVRADLPAPLPDLESTLNLSPGTVSLDRLRPVSLNLKLKTPGAVGVTLSGGVSYLPALSLTVTQPLALGVTGLSGGQFQIASLALKAEGRPEADGGRSQFGVNGGVGLRLALGSHLALSAEGRYFFFGKNRLTWSPVSEGPLTPLEESLLRAALLRLETVEFNPQCFQATVGLAVVF